MMGIETIRAESRAAAVKAARAHKQPFVYELEDKGKIKADAIPYIGDYKPTGWAPIKDHFVDSSGFGRPEEYAETIEFFTSNMVVGHGYAVTEAGQFQVYVTEFEPVPPSIKL